MKKKELIGVLVAALLIFGTAAFPLAKAWAHTLETDGAISGELHIEPDHVATAGVPAPAIIRFTDANNQLDLRACDCQVTIAASGTVLYSGKFGVDPNFVFGNSSVRFSYTFPKAGNYDLTMEGKPVPPANFQSFKLVYDVVTLDKDDAATTSMSMDEHQHGGGIWGHYLHLGLFGIAFLLCLYIVIRDKRRMKK